MCPSRADTLRVSPPGSLALNAPLRLEVDLPSLVLGLVVGHGVATAWAPDPLTAEIDARIEACKGTDFPPPPLRKAVCDLLRAHGYKPTGRGKPASEYLARAVDRDAFPRINNLVDLCNLTSLETGLPVSLFDLDQARVDDQSLAACRSNPKEPVYARAPV